MTILVQQQLRYAAQQVSLWGGSLTHTWKSQADDYTWIVGHVDEDGVPYTVARVEADAYDYQGVSEKLAEFFRLANPAAVLALLDEIDRLNLLVIERETVRIGQSLQRHDDQKQIDELVALGIQQDKDDIARLKAENERWRQNYEHLIEQHMPRTGHGCEEGWSRVVEARELQEQLDQVKAENAELKLDAGRYRWLRDRTGYRLFVYLTCQPASIVDAEIDQAMTKEQQA